MLPTKAGFGGAGPAGRVAALLLPPPPPPPRGAGRAAAAAPHSRRGSRGRPAPIMAACAGPRAPRPLLLLLLLLGGCGASLPPEPPPPPPPPPPPSSPEPQPLPESALQKPTVLLAIIARNAAHTLPHFLGCIERLHYPKSRLALWYGGRGGGARRPAPRRRGCGLAGGEVRPLRPRGAGGAPASTLLVPGGERGLWGSWQRGRAREGGCLRSSGRRFSRSGGSGGGPAPARHR